MNEPLPDEALRGSFQQAIATWLQISAVWEQHRHRLMAEQQMRLQQTDDAADPDRGGAFADAAAVDGPTAGRARAGATDRGFAADQERLDQAWPLVAQVDPEWVQGAGHTDLARAWVHAAAHEAMSGSPARRQTAGGAADLIEGQLRQRAPHTMRRYDAAREQGQSRADAMAPVVRVLDGELSAGRQARPAGAGARTAASAPRSTAQPSAAQAGPRPATDADRVRRACQQAAASWGARPFRRPAAAARTTGPDTGPQQAASQRPAPGPAPRHSR